MDDLSRKFVRLCYALMEMDFPFPSIEAVEGVVGAIRTSEAGVLIFETSDSLKKLSAWAFKAI